MNSFSDTAEAIAMTSSKLQKRRLLAGYLQPLGEGDLYWAVSGSNRMNERVNGPLDE